MQSHLGRRPLNLAIGETMKTALLTRLTLAKRWNCSGKKVDRLRQSGLLPWIDLTAGLGKRPSVRIRLIDVLSFEEKNLMDISKEKR